MLLYIVAMTLHLHAWSYTKRFGEYRKTLFVISIPGNKILDSDWLTAVHYLSIVCFHDGKSVKRPISCHKRGFSTHKLYKYKNDKRAVV